MAYYAGCQPSYLTQTRFNTRAIYLGSVLGQSAAMASYYQRKSYTYPLLGTKESGRVQSVGVFINTVS